jgi:hypothetical protein
MIRLYYLKEKLEQTKFDCQLAPLLADLSPSTDVAIFRREMELSMFYNSLACAKTYISDFLSYVSVHHPSMIVSINKIDIEELSARNLKNIFLIDFESMDQHVLRGLINLTCKKTNILGISNDYNELYKKLELEINYYFKEGYSLDQISVQILLRYNLPSSLVDDLIENHKQKNYTTQEIESIDFLKSYIKH